MFPTGSDEERLAIDVFFALVNDLRRYEVDERTQGLLSELYDLLETETVELHRPPVASARLKDEGISGDRRGGRHDGRRVPPGYQFSKDSGRLSRDFGNYYLPGPNPDAERRAKNLLVALGSLFQTASGEPLVKLGQFTGVSFNIRLDRVEALHASANAWFLPNEPPWRVLLESHIRAHLEHREVLRLRQSYGLPDEPKDEFTAVQSLLRERARENGRPNEQLEVLSPQQIFENIKSDLGDDLPPLLTPQVIEAMLDQASLAKGGGSSRKRKIGTILDDFAKQLGAETPADE